MCVYDAPKSGRVMQEGKNWFDELCHDRKSFYLLWL